MQVESGSTVSGSLLAEVCEPQVLLAHPNHSLSLASLSSVLSGGPSAAMNSSAASASLPLSLLSRRITHTHEIVTSKRGPHSWVLGKPHLCDTKSRTPMNVYPLSLMFAAPRQGSYKSVWHVTGPSERLWMSECNFQFDYCKVNNNFIQVGLELARCLSLKFVIYP